jgi:oxygen-independent coproporphyrinogen-3 oxidase
MISFSTNQPEFFNDLSDVVRLFFGMEKISPVEEGAGLAITHRFSAEGSRWFERCEVKGGGRPKAEKALAFDAVSGGRLHVERLKKRYAKLCLYALLKEYMGFAPPWGSLTGIRPTKLARQLMDEGLSLPQAVEELQSLFDVSAPKARLVGDVLRAQEGLYRWGDAERFDVYAGIPFCRTRCLYCSFFSAGMGKPETVRAYFEALLREIEAFGSFMKERGKRCRAVYVGGGTPVAVETGLLRSALEALRAAFPGAQEFTVEAGRPDCVTGGNMRMLRELGVGRVSVNPQTMNARTLEIIGRGHTPADVLEAFAAARGAGIPAVNMDIIAGLPGEGPGDMAATLEALAPLGMDDLTVHTLAIKHSSRLNERLEEYPLPDAAAASEMLDLAQASAIRRGMRPYYMYRQKYMAGNLENVGYALPGAECLYNIDMMEETHDIVALGAGAVSKRMFYEETRHERYPNPKNIEHYIMKIDAIIGGKKKFFG